MQKTGEVYAQTGASAFGPYGPVLRGWMDELEKVVETNTGRKLSTNTHNAIWNTFNTTFPKPTEEQLTVKVGDWRGKSQAGPKPSNTLSS